LLFRKLLTIITKPFTKGRLVSAKVVANLVKLVNKESLANQENQASLVTQETQDSLAWFLLNTAKFQLNHRATHAHQARLDPQVLQVKTAKMAMAAKTEDQAKTVHQAQPDHQAHQVDQVNQAPMDPEVMQAEMLKDKNHNPVTKDQTVQMANQVQQVQQEMPAKMEAKAQTDRKDHQAQLVTAAKTVNQATKDHQAPMANPEKRVSAPNIVPSMVESSSKMAQGDKRLFPNLFRIPNAMFFLVFFKLTSYRH